MGIKEWIIPQDKVFFDLFERMAATVVVAAYELVALIDHMDELKVRARKIEQLEHQGDKISHEIFEHLNRTFITPLDPGEISALASALDDILDYIDGSAQMMLNYGITTKDPSMEELAELVQLCVVEIEGAVKGIRDVKNPKEIESRCIEVNRLENLADNVLARAISDLFRTNDAVQIIKLKDLYECLEIATDMCEDAANVLSDIAIRHS